MNHSEKEFQKVASMKERLNSVSPSFCLVRWRHATINLASGASKSCCHHPFKSIDSSNTLKHIHDNQEEKKLRQDMIDGKRPKDCSYCWWVENNGHSSDRHNWSAKSWMAPFFDETTQNLTAEANEPSWVELNFSSVCNLKCVYCSPIFSSKWYKEIKTYGPYPTQVPFNSIEDLNHIEFQEQYENTELLKKFWPWLEDSIAKIHLLKLTGGEPLLSKQTFRLLDLMADKKLPDLTLGINSNLSVKQDTWDQFIECIQKIERNKSINRVYLHPSLDTYGTRAEYIRSGLEFKLLQKNVEKFLLQTNASVHFICTLNNLALGGLLDYWKYLLVLKQTYHKPDREISISTEILQAPQWMNINLLGKDYIYSVDETISFVQANISEAEPGFSHVELEGLKKAKSAMLSTPEDINTGKSDFYHYFREVDQRRKSNFKATFPELIDFYEHCQKISLL